MKLTINAVWAGKEIIQSCVEQANAQGVKCTEENIKILVLSKEGDKEVEIAPDRLRLVFKS